MTDSILKVYDPPGWRVLLEEGDGLAHAILMGDIREVGGELRCVTCVPHKKVNPWCAHIDKLITAGEDAPVVATYLTVPIFPKDGGIWTPVRLSSSVDGARQVFWTERGADEFLGFLHDTEGRRTLRQMVLDRFYSYSTKEKLQCKSTSHGFREEMWLKKNVAPDTGTFFANAWKIFFQGWCLVCAKNMESLDDVVPF